MSEIPGSFKVGDKRGGDSGNKNKKRLKVSEEELHKDPKLVPKYRNYIQFLNNRELGLTAGVQAEKDLCQMKTSHKEKALSCNLQMPFSYDSCEVNFIAGDDISVYGNWRMSTKKETYYIVGEISHNVGNESQIYRRSQRIVDMCRGSADFVFATSYSPQPSPSEISVLGIVIHDYKAYCPPPWYCCCYIPASDAALFGSDRCIRIINGRGACLTKVKIAGKVLTLSYHIPSRLLLTGLYTGVLRIDDLRIHSDAYSFKILDKAIRDSVFLNDHEVIVTDVESNLVKVDLRTKKTSAIFLGHKHSYYKRPFSVANDMVCATGVDNVIRIWHISGGYPIYAYKSTSGHEVRGWLNSQGNKTYLSYFERDTRTIFTI